MSKFIIQFDLSKKNNNNELLPLMNFVPGALSLSNTGKTYSLFIGELNKSAFFNTIDIFKSNTEIYKKILSMLPTPTEVVEQITIIHNKPLDNQQKLNNNIKHPLIKFNLNTGQIRPYVFSGINPKYIPPSPTKNSLEQIRKKTMESININRNITKTNDKPFLPLIQRTRFK